MPRRDDGFGRAGAVGVAGHRRQELVPRQRNERGIRRGADGGGPRDVTQQRDLPERVARAELPDGHAVDEGFEASGFHDEEAVARLALPDDLGAGRDADVLQPTREVLDRRQLERPEEGHAAQEAELALRDHGRIVDAPNPRPADDDERHLEAAGGEQRPGRAEPVDEHRRGHRAGGECRGDERLEEGEDLAAGGGRDGPLEEAVAGDLEDRLARPARDEEGDRRQDERHERGSREADPLQGDRAAERRSEPRLADQGDGQDAAEHHAQADGRR